MESRLGRNPYGTPVVNRQGQEWDFGANRWKPRENQPIIEPRVIFDAVMHAAGTLFSQKEPNAR